MRIVEVVAYDPTWSVVFEAEAQQIAQAMGDNMVAIHHIGSTAIPGIYAKPIIDLLVEVNDIMKVDERRANMVALGYVALGEFGISGRRYFRKENQNGIRTHHVHTFEAGTAEVMRHLAFREYMRAHPDEAQRYSDLKRDLAKQYPTNIDRYMDGKDGLIKAMDRKAAQWHRGVLDKGTTMKQEEFLPEAISRLFEQLAEPDHLLTAVVSALGAVLPCDRCFLYLREPTQKQGMITHCWSRDGQADIWIGADWLEDPTAPEDPLMTIALRTPVAVFVDDVETAGSDVVDLAYEQEKFRHRALIHAPIDHDGLLIGILECSIFEQPRLWTERDRQLISGLQTKLTEPVRAYIEHYHLFQPQR